MIFGHQTFLVWIGLKATSMNVLDKSKLQVQIVRQTEMIYDEVISDWKTVTFKSLMCLNGYMYVSSKTNTQKEFDRP